MPNSYPPISVEPLPSPNNPTRMCHFYSPQPFQTSSIPLTSPIQSLTALPSAAVLAALFQKREKHQPLASYPTAQPAPPPTALYEEAYLSSKPLQPSQEPLFSNFSFTSDSLSPAFKHASPVAISRRGCFFAPNAPYVPGPGVKGSNDPRSPMLLPPPAVTIIYQLHTQLKNCIPGSLHFHSTSYHPMLTRIQTIQTTSWPPRS